ncbi:MAG: peptidase M22, partial [Acutalibacteraceae bacterium]
MTACLGFDTSNYTTSVAWADAAGGRVEQEKRLLPVREGQLGLRQSDAVFHHVRQLPELVEILRGRWDKPVDCVAASERPQERDGSYMPCFLVGSGAARQLAAALGVPYHAATHQQGHVVAAAFGAGRLDLLEKPFLAFHVSGGTTDALTVDPDKASVITCRVAARSLDLKAGQLIDRVGGMLGLSFPAGPALEQLASASEKTYTPRVPVRDGCCSLSGVQNQCEQMHRQGIPAADIARYCLDCVRAALEAMTEAL